GQDRLLPEHPGVTLAAAGTLALVQAMTDLDLVAPLGPGPRWWPPAPGRCWAGARCGTSPG
ncbi:hypothetical protein, partial [Micromonospora aurantiaca (nom. illeg.)]|uniref:hypothetical protein n=1 Tax=Micromonospora aurantiaca (nom. illeg.) TaxID=47850 RepID=UPI003819FED0